MRPYESSLNRVLDRIEQEWDGEQFPVRRFIGDIHSISFEQMGQVQSEKIPLTSFCRRTPDGREWIAVGKAWKLLADLDRDEADFRDTITRY